MKTDLTHLRDSQPEDGRIRPDLVAGFITAAVVLPKAMAYATIAGLPVVAGLYTVLVSGVIYGLIGSSTVLSVSSTTTLAILTGAQLALIVPDGDPVKLISATATLTALIGIFLLTARVLRLGFVANFISTPVLTGFKAGIGLVILLDQVPKLLGLHFQKGGFFADVLSLVRHLPQTSLPTLAVGSATLLVLVAAERLKPHSPAPLVIVAAAIAASWLFDFEARGVSVVGHIPPGLPAITWPEASLILPLIPGAFGIALMSFTETIAAGRAFALPRDPPINAQRELVATGAANVAGSLLGAMPGGGGTSQTGVARAAGGRSQRTSFVVAMAALATMLFLAPVLAPLPNATLAAVLIVYSASLIDPGEFAAIYRVRKMEFRWALAAAFGVLIFGTLQGIVFAIVVSAIGLVRQIADPVVSIIGRKPGADVLRPLSPEHPNDETIDGLLIVRPEGRLFFVNAQNVADRIAALALQHRPRVLVIDLSRVPDIEYSALQMLIEADKRAAERKATVWLVGLNPGVLEAVRRSGLDKRLGPERMLHNTRTAIERFKKMEAASASITNDLSGNLHRAE